MLRACLARLDERAIEGSRYRFCAFGLVAKNDVSQIEVMPLSRERTHRSPRIALVAPYEGGNLGGFAIHESIIGNLRRYAPEIEICGITLDPAKTSALHGIPAYPLGANPVPHFDVAQGQPGGPQAALPRKAPRWLKGLLKRMPFAMPLKAFIVELRHCAQIYRLMRTVDLLVIGGGGQLDEEWGGPWGHPYALAKWSVLARVAGSAVVFVSVGACVVKSTLTKIFLRTALSLSCYRSYRDPESRKLALSTTSRAEGPVVPDLAFGLPTVPRLSEVAEVKHHRVGISPIAYNNARFWPTVNQAQYDRYMTELATFASELLRRGTSVTLFCSALPDDQTYADLIDRLDPDVKSARRDHLSITTSRTVAELRDILASLDFVVASRLHGVLLSFLSKKPTIAISYDKKVNSLMDELGQSLYCVDIHSFKSDDLSNLFAKLENDRSIVIREVTEIQERYGQILREQYRALIQQILRQGTDPLDRYASNLLREQAAA